MCPFRSSWIVYRARGDKRGAATLSHKHCQGIQDLDFVYIIRTVVHCVPSSRMPKVPKLLTYLGWTPCWASNTRHKEREYGVDCFLCSQYNPVQAHYSTLAYRTRLRSTDTQCCNPVPQLPHPGTFEPSIGLFFSVLGASHVLCLVDPCSSEPATLTPEQPTDW